MIQPFAKVLVATDFSEQAVQAVERAVDVAHRFNAALHVVHVWEIPVTAYGPMGVTTIDLSTPIEEAARTQLDAVVAGLRARGIDVESSLVQGVAWDGIVSLAERVGADLVVVGTHGRTGVRRVLMGSVAERVVRHAGCAVLTVR